MVSEQLGKRAVGFSISYLKNLIRKAKWSILNFNYPLGMNFGKHFWKQDDSGNHICILQNNTFWLMWKKKSKQESVESTEKTFSNFSVLQSQLEGFSNWEATMKFSESPPTFWISRSDGTEMGHYQDQNSKNISLIYIILYYATSKRGHIL